MKTTILLITFFFVCQFSFSQSSTNKNINKELAKLEHLIRLTDSQKKDIVMMLNAYNKHKEDLQTAYDVVEDDEESYDENLKSILNKEQYRKCTYYIKNRLDSINKNKRIIQINKPLL